ncbi:xanthine dehydrogenase family protein molybdopterin-binding subunit [Clostridium cylindrosporum]|uniref:Putative hypoxanthine oxidase XdhD n=1 Tax=Clostridium cylindrosporum DSM 605 TaxID=1121307 RepID=A0A0J8DD36_CLOCY|nr:molybdopterin cofactor-binding domain-containing protein [Clostridium cylindrosporum]KMT22164.1 putative hypoxanthine oxidase XdhD [Clostridium cylindrosporum DSM 605]
MYAIKKSIPKVDAMGNILGGHVYADDVAPKDALIIKILRSPHAFAKIINIDTTEALKLEGVECVLTYKDCPDIRITRAGQAYPEESPYDFKILDQIVRYVGDDVALVVAKTEKIALAAMELVKVEYEVYEPVLDMEKAIDHPSIIHPEDDIVVHQDTHFNPKRNIAAQVDIANNGDMKKTLEECDIVHSGTYYIPASHQGMMETFRSSAYIDPKGRLVITSSTQIPFHNRRQVARALDIPESKVRVIKPRIGGGFGAKQNSNTEFYPALVTWITKKPSKVTFTREETFESGSPRHPMKIDVTIGLMKDGKLRAIDMVGLSDTGAFAEHGRAVFLQVGMKSIGMYNKCDAVRFHGDVVYTNHLTYAAYRGYGATQGDYALESCINEACKKYGIDPIEFRVKNVVRENETAVPFGFFGQPAPPKGYALESCQLVACIERGREIIEWDKKYGKREISPTKRRGLGMACGRQGSGIPGVDMASAVLKLNNDGSFQLLIGATDLGTGSDTILSQICAEELTVPFEAINVFSSDTDFTPYDCGAYASSTTYVSGNAIKNTATKMRGELIREAAVILDAKEEDLFIEDGQVKSKVDDKSITFQGIAYKLGCSCKQLLTSDSFTGKGSPVPYIAGFAEVEVDIETGKIDLTQFVGVLDVGTVVNPALARVQAEGGILQGIGMALWETVVHNEKGKMLSNNFLKYPMPVRDNFGTIKVDFVESYEPTGPFGAKSIGEVVLNSSAPAIRAAIIDAVGPIQLDHMPFTPSLILSEINKLKKQA